jgi:mRNA-degrading endonuclease YafQ of YafQ-DinJ toxin-antitoxin module
LSYILLRSSAFVRDAKRLLRRRPELEDQLRETLRLLEADPQDARLKSHKLKGKLKNSWACSAGYDLRVVFSFTKHGRKPAILLETVGTHDEVY